MARLGLLDYNTLLLLLVLLYSLNKWPIVHRARMSIGLGGFISKDTGSLKPLYLMLDQGPLSRAST